MDVADIINPINGTPLPHLLLPLSQVLALTLPPFRHRRHIFIPIIFGLLCTCWITHYENTAVGRAINGAHWTVALGTIEKLWFGIPENEYWRNGCMPREAASMPFGLRKLQWALSLMANQRGINWNFQVKPVPPPDGPLKKWPWMAHQLRKYLQSYIISDILWVYFDKYHHYDGVNIAFKDLQNAPSWTASFMNALCAGFKMYFPIQMNYLLASMVTVLLGVYSPEDWPPVFGSVKEAVTIRKFWGSFWHQYIRKIFNSYSDNAAQFLGLKPRSNAASYFKLYLAFLISGWVHGMLCWSMPANRFHTFNDRFGTVFWCFVSNAVAIHVEDIALYVFQLATQHIAVAQGERWWKRTIGYLWVTAWIWWCCIWGANGYLRMGITGICDVPFPIMGRVIEEGRIVVLPAVGYALQHVKESVTRLLYA